MANNSTSLLDMMAMSLYCSVSRLSLSSIYHMPTGAECLAESIAIVEDVCGPMEAIELPEECGL